MFIANNNNYIHAEKCNQFDQTRGRFISIAIPTKSIKYLPIILDIYERYLSELFIASSNCPKQLI